MDVLFRLCLLLGCAASLPLAAQELPFPQPARAYPGDRIGVPALSGGCPAVIVDPNRAPQVKTTQIHYAPNPEQDIYEHEVDYWLVQRQGDICDNPPPPLDYRALIDVGGLTSGRHRFKVTAHYNNAIFANYTTPEASVRVHEYPGTDMSGAWYSTEQSGRGVYVLVAGDVAVVQWATHDAQGEAIWIVMTAPYGYIPDANGNLFQGTAMITSGTPLAPGPATISHRRWGTLRFAYNGCGRAHLTWDADDPAIGDGSMDLVQLLQPDGTNLCDIRSRTAGPPAVFIEGD